MKQGNIQEKKNTETMRARGRERKKGRQGKGMEEGKRQENIEKKNMLKRGERWEKNKV